MPRISDFMERKGSEIVAPPVLPIGEYIAQVMKFPSTEDLNGRDGVVYEKMTYQCAIVDVIEADEDDIAEFGRVPGTPFRVDFLIDTSEEGANKAEAAMNRMKEFLMACGVFDDDTQLGDAIAAAPTSQFGVEIAHRNNPNDPDRPYIEPKRTYKLD